MISVSLLGVAISLRGVAIKYLSIVGRAMPYKTRILWAMPTLRICSKIK
jgi:hypothetical protein